MSNLNIKCKICDKPIKSAVGLSSHLRHAHPEHNSYSYYNKYYSDANEDGLCKICGNPTAFISILNGYRDYCSSRCANLDPNVQSTKLYNKSNMLDVSKRKSKVNDSDCENSSNILLCKLFKPFKDKRVLYKRKKIDEFCKRYSYSRLDKVGIGIAECCAKMCQVQLVRKFGVLLIENDDISSILNCYGNMLVDELDCITELEIKKFIKSVYNTDIAIRSSRVIKSDELDLYISSKHLAIEYDSNYWHNSNVFSISKNYQINKTNKCEALGIRLIHISNWDWLYKTDICKSIITDALSIYKCSLNYTECEFKTADELDSSIFLTENYIHGYVKAKYKFGLYYNNKLVYLIGLNKAKYDKSSYELMYACVKNNYHVYGGLKFLISKQPYAKILSYVDRSKFVINDYLDAGFKKINTEPPSYAYYKEQFKITHKEMTNHFIHKFIKKSANMYKNEIKSMTKMGWLQVYDSGRVKLKYNRKEN